MKRKNEPSLHDAVRELLAYLKGAMPIPNERRKDARLTFIYPVLVEMPDGNRLQCLTRDVSLNGMRLLSKHMLAGQKLRVLVPRADKKADPFCFVLQILWSAAIGDGLFDSGGLFMEVVDPKRR